MIPFPDCLRCGACCFSASPRFVRVTGDDWERLGSRAEELAHFLGNRAYMKMTAGHCAALALRPTPEGTMEFFCTVYAQRPQVCRDLARGGPACEAERMIKLAERRERADQTPVVNENVM